MTNKEKLEYINNLTRNNFPVPRRSLVVIKTDIKPPTTLYKYRKFDKYTFEMLDKNIFIFVLQKN